MDHFSIAHFLFSSFLGGSCGLVPPARGGSRRLFQSTRTKETNPTKPKRLKLLHINEMRLCEEKQTQMAYPAYYQIVAERNGPIFEENGCPPHRIRAEIGTNPNKPKWHKPIYFSEIDRSGKKQTQASYQACFQEVAAKRGPIFEENGWMRIPADSDVAIGRNCP